ncbi:MAG: hypothetical protein PHP73_04460 [Candidatus Omnitrophica bacterium]|nr:hypothetical protein [Candidatus Omnitrophota bacterium]
MKKCLLAIFSLAILFGFTSSSYADRRSYVWTYEYMIMPKGMWELETYVTSEVPNLHKSNINVVKPQVELEYGITSRWDVAMYQAWKFKNKKYENDSEYEGFKLRTRYRIGEKGKFFVDPLLYFEYIRDDDFSKPNVGEAKLVLAKDIGGFNLSYNQIIKRNLEREGKTDHEYAAGINYAFTPRFKAGFESKGNYPKEKYALGPTVSYAFKKAFIAAGAVFGLNERADDLQTRMIVGVLF